MNREPGDELFLGLFILAVLAFVASTVFLGFTLTEVCHD